VKYLADENIPLEAVQQLRAAGLDVASASELMAGSADLDVLELANREDRVIITFDKDFAELVFRGHRPAPSGVMLLRVRPRSRGSVAETLLLLLRSDRSWHGHFSVITDKRVRMVPLA